MTHMNWADYWRVFNVIACTTCLLVLLVRFVKYHKTYNEKTRDYWYSLFMWTLAGVVGSAFAITLNAPTNPGLVLTSAAAIVSFKGLINKSQWGGPR